MKLFLDETPTFGTATECAMTIVAETPGDLNTLQILFQAGLIRATEFADKIGPPIPVPKRVKAKLARI